MFRRCAAAGAFLVMVLVLATPREASAQDASSFIATLGQQAIQVRRFLQAIVNRLPDERLIGYLDVADDVFLASGLSGEHGRQQIVGPHA